jgi:hypothetical protein
MNTSVNTEINLLQSVRAMLFEAGLGQETVAFFDNDPYLLRVAQQPADAQRVMLNRYWNLQLLTKHGSIEERYCLLPNGTFEDWLRLFKEKILPFLITHRLPTNIG